MQRNANGKTGLNLAWLVKMALRDSRRNRSRLVLFISSIILGIAALVATFSFGDNVESDIDNQAKTLVGADLVLESSSPILPATKSMLGAQSVKQSSEYSFASMIYFKRTNGTRLVQVRALDGAFPFYGSLETIPANAGTTFRQGRYALVDKTLMLQFDAKEGDSVQVGETTFVIAGILEKAPGRTGFSTSVAPPVYIPLQYIEETKLLQKGSRISYHYYLLFPEGTDVEKKVGSMEKMLEKERVDMETVASRKKSTGRAFNDFSRFLTLTSFIALLLGCIGVASSIHIYIREKINSIAILRCLGARGSQAFLIYLFQIAGIGLLGSILGAIAGVLVQQLMPLVFKDFLPIDITTAVSWTSIGKGILIGVTISILFALLPLISIRKISPLNTIRLFVDNAAAKRDYGRWAIFALIIVCIALFSRWQLKTWSESLVFTVSVCAAFLILTLVAQLLIWLVRRFFPFSWNYLWRQGFANLYRPNNQTLILITTIGLGVLFISTLYNIQGILMNRVTLSASNNQPNMVLFDIQTGQQKQVSDLTRQFQLPVIQEVPIVTMRIEEINGRTGEQVKADSTSKIPPQAFEWEFRVTYRDTLTNSEKIKDGKLGRSILTPTDTIFISMDAGYADRIHLKTGDRIVFNVQGARLPTVLGSTREVDWNRIQTNFRVVFPSGVLEKAPQFHVLVTRVPSPEVSAKFQQAVVKTFPNVSVIDVGLVLRVLDEILSKIGLVIRFMSGFSILTGLVVLIASVLISKYQRIQEIVLLRTLGASRRQILSITALEYFFLGALASITGILLSLVGSWALAKYVFDAPFQPGWISMVTVFLVITIITVLIGVYNSRGVLNKSPLEILRKEV